MLGHNAVKLTRIMAAKQILLSALKQIDASLKDASYDADFEMTIAMLKDAKEILEKD